MRTRAPVIAVVFALLLGALAGCRTNPVTGEPVFTMIGPEQELAMGDNTHPNIIHMYDGEYQDPELDRYLGSIVMRLHANSHRQEMPVDFTVLNTSVINAFATPAHVYATRGFLAELDNEAQFASVMGHEWAHVTALHSARQMSRGMLTNLMLGVGSSLVGNSAAGQVATQLTAVSVTLLGLQYSRSQEHQADRVGTVYMALAGWDPYQAVEMMEILGSLNKREASFLDKYLSTHPQTDDRIADIRRVIEEMNLADRYVQGDGVFADRWKKRLAGLVEAQKDFEPYDEGTKALSEERFQDALGLAEEAIGRNADFAQFHRLKGDALVGLGRTDEAATAFERALSLYPRYEPARIGLGQVDLETGRYARAENRFRRVTQNWPGSVNGYYGLGLALYHQEKFQEAIDPMESVAQAAPKNAAVLYVLASCYDRVDRNADAVAAYRAAVQAGLTGQRKERALERIDALGGTQP